MDPLQAFAVDVMLGRLARWLRILGHDTAYGRHLRGRALATCARRERRLLLTRDSRLVRDPELPRHVFVTSNDFRQQLRQVAAVVPLGGGMLRRCLDCNEPLEGVAREGVEGEVPPYVHETQTEFWRCPRCRHLYWPATHRDRIHEELTRIGLVSGSAA